MGKIKRFLKKKVAVIKARVKREAQERRNERTVEILARKEQRAVEQAEFRKAKLAQGKIEAAKRGRAAAKQGGGGGFFGGLVTAGGNFSRNIASQQSGRKTVSPASSNMNALLGLGGSGYGGGSNINALLGMSGGPRPASVKRKKRRKNSKSSGGGKTITIKVG